MMTKRPIRNLRRAILMYRVRKRNHTLAAIGKAFGISRERVRQILFVYESRYIPGTDILRDPPKDLDHLIMPKKHADAARLWVGGEPSIPIKKYDRQYLLEPSKLIDEGFAEALGIPKKVVNGKSSYSISSHYLKLVEKRAQRNRKHSEKVLNKMFKEKGIRCNILLSKRSLLNARR